MATTLTALWGNWGHVRTVRSGHFACYFPGNAQPADTLVLYGPDGREVARNTEAVRDFDLGINEATGEIFAVYTRFVSNGVPVRRWDTGVKVPLLTTAPAPAPSGTQLDRIEAGVNAIRAKVGA